ncbi:MAG: OmpA family protein [Bacteroidales bacterium]|nr:OmpA family protein [Bacteroidales bacterium]
MKKIAIALMCAIMLLPGCGNMNNTGKGAIIGTGAGATIGAIIGALITKDGKGAAIGAAVGAAAGGGSGALIGHAMDKKAKELAELEGTNVEVVDINGFKGIKVTFKDGILFDFNKSNVSETAKAELKEFADKMADFEQTNITILGHTDNIGSESANLSVSKKRASSVANYLAQCGIAKERLTHDGMGYSMPVVDNDTPENRAKNRRVEVYVSANEEMIAAAEAEAKAQQN